MSRLQNILTEDLRRRKLIAVAVNLLLSVPLTIWAIYGIGEYGIVLFIMIPLLIGLNSSVILGYELKVQNRQAVIVAYVSIILLVLGLLVFAIEGLVCIAMSLPFALLLTLLGVFIGKYINERRTDLAPKSIIILLCSIPLMGFFEGTLTPQIEQIKTTVTITADVQTVWKNVIEFPKLREPDEFIFKVGISYPIEATIAGKGVGAIRYCNFNTGDFVEPITIWKENEVLAFDVDEQPLPMTEISIWDVNAPHLHDYFTSTRGQFELTQLENGNVELTGTTWYYHRIRPAFYWRIWSKYIIHKIHERVLIHIKENSEINDTRDNRVR